MKIVITLLLLLSTFCSVAIDAKDDDFSPIDIVVGIGERAPFYMKKEQRGATQALLDALNKVQDQYIFRTKVIPSKRRVQAISESWVDVLMWDNPKWGLKNLNTNTTLPLVFAKDLYIALKKEGRDNLFFNEINQGRIAFVNGYHYRFADFEIDSKKLRNRFRATFVRTEDASIKMVLNNRVDYAVVSNTALNWFWVQYPETKQALIVGKEADTQYQRFIVVPDSAPITAQDINNYLVAADKQNLLLPIYQEYGLEKPEFAALSKAGSATQTNAISK